jgi:O-antigen ligase
MQELKQFTDALQLVRELGALGALLWALWIFRLIARDFAQSRANPVPKRGTNGQ